MFENKKVMARNILHYMEVNNVTATDVCKACGFKQNTFSDWVNAKTYPRIDKIELMANYFNINKAYLVEDVVFRESITSGHTKSEAPIAVPPDQNISTEDRALLDRLHRISPGTRNSIELLIEGDLRKHGLQD